MTLPTEFLITQVQFKLFKIGNYLVLSLKKQKSKPRNILKSLKFAPSIEFEIVCDCDIKNDYLILNENDF